MSERYFIAPLIFDGERGHLSSALAVKRGVVEEIVAQTAVPENGDVTRFSSGMIAPGFVDLQVNGGGGVLLNDDTSAQGIASICAAHRAYGVTSLLPTLITDTPQRTGAAIAAAREAAKHKTVGFCGLHLEGPHLSIARKGTHDPALIRPMTAADLDVLIAAKDGLETLLVTVAVESATPEQVKALAKSGVRVSLGHSDADYDTAMKYFDAGATCVTHLYNAMSQLGNREPGLVGAALASGGVHAGLIADGFHVHPQSMKFALLAKTGPGRIHLVSDAMSTVGSDIKGLTLNGRRIYRKDGRLTLADGTLAGADTDMISSVRLVHEQLGVERQEALRMAGLYPAQCIGRSDEIGALKPGSRADFLHLSETLDVEAVYIGGV